MSVETAIKETITYAKRFGAKLSAKQIKQRLLGPVIYQDNDIDQVLQTMEDKLQHEDKRVADKMNQAQELTRNYLEVIDDVLVVGVTGSVAAESAKKNDDIDLIMIIKTNRLWWVRLKLRWLIWKEKIPHRRYGQIEKKDEFCFNLWLDEAELELPSDKKTFQSALDLMMMKPILNRGNTYERFLKANSWAKRYVATGYNRLIANLKFRVYKNRKKNIVLDVINYLCFVGQYVYMRSKMRGEIVSLRQAFFHPVV